MRLLMTLLCILMCITASFSQDSTRLELDPMMPLVLVKVDSVSSIDSSLYCMTAAEMDTLMTSVEVVVERNELLVEQVSVERALNELQKQENEKLTDINNNNAFMVDLCEQSLIEVDLQLQKTKKSLNRQKKLKWVWAGLGAIVTTTIIRIAR